jgi:peptidoglycan/xylan/chitin deacetylase (PgdA/CDA1 family)
MTNIALGEAHTSRTFSESSEDNGMLRILAYHRITDPHLTPELEPALVSATPDVFHQQLLHLVRRYHVVSLEDVLTAFRGGRPLPSRSVLLTFDDAYRDFKEEAWPILRELGLPATLFVPTAYPGRTDRAFWWDRLHRILNRHDWKEEPGSSRGPAGGGLLALSEEPVPDIGSVRARMKGLSHEEVERVLDALVRARPWTAAPSDAPAVLSWDELRELAREGVTLGAHTRWHRALTRTTEERVRDELRLSLADLREHVEDAPAIISYPYGFHNDRVVRVVREEGFELGFTCLDGLNRVDETDPLRLHRTVVTRRTTPFIFRLRMRPWFVAVDRWRNRSQRSVATQETSAHALREGLAGIFPILEPGTP